MSIVMQINPFDYFSDLKGDALDEGFIWIGEPNKDPRQFPVPIYFDKDLTIPALQPLRTNAGYVVRGNAPTFLYVDGNYSVLVQDKKRRQIFYVPDFLFIGSGQAVSLDTLGNSVGVGGAGLVGYGNSTVGATLDRRPQIQRYHLPTDGLDWLPAFQRARAAGQMRLYAPKGDYGMSATAFLQAGFFVEGSSRDTTFYALPGSSFTSGFMFMINTDDGINWLTPFPNMNTGGFENCQFDNRNGIAALRGVKCYGSGKFSQLRFNGFRQSIARPTGFYCDSFQVHDIIAENPQDNTEYQLDISGLGDGFTANDIHCPYDSVNNRSMLAMHVRGVNGGTISDCIGGDYLIELAGDLNIVGGHFERAQHIYDSCNVTVSSQFLPDTRLPIITKATFASAANESRYLVRLQNTTFRNVEGLMEWTGFHVSKGDGVTLSIANCNQEWTVQGFFQAVQKAGIRVCQEDQVTPVPSFNNYSYLTSHEAVVDIPNLVSLNHLIRQRELPFAGIVTGSTEARVIGVRNGGADQWKIPIGTYYYNAQVLYDAGRAIGRSPVNAESAIVVTDKTGMVVNNIGFNQKPRSGIIRLYRGTVAGSYDSFVDIHTIGTSWLFDNGLAVNGVAWLPRTAGPMNGINSFGESLHLVGGLVELYSDASITPTFGAWTQGDTIKNTTGTISASRVLQGLYRITTSSANNLNVDWARQYVATV